MKQLDHMRSNNLRGIIERRNALILLILFWLGGCSIWNADLDPNYHSTRAEQLCHPYGQCSQGTWVGVNRLDQDPTVAKSQCTEEVDQRYGNGWWVDSVARGLEIGKCMETKGYRLKQ